MDNFFHAKRKIRKNSQNFEKFVYSKVSIRLYARLKNVYKANIVSEYKKKNGLKFKWAIRCYSLAALVVLGNF